MSTTHVGGIDPAVFRETLGHYPTGVAVVTGLDAAGAPVGMVVGTFSSISLDPPLVSFSPQKTSATFALLRECASFCVNVLAADQEDVCRQMATGGAGKFEDVSWTSAPAGSPVLDDVVAWIECSWEQVIEAGDHYIVLGRVLDLAVPRSVPPLLFFQGGYGKFSSPSLMAAASPDLLEAVRLAEAIREDVEQCSADLGLTCSVSAKIASEIVTVLVAQPGDQPGAQPGDQPGASAGGRTGAQAGEVAEPTTVGQRAPHIAPLGAAFLHDAPAEDVEAWMSHLGTADAEILDRLQQNLAAVRQRGYSIAERSQASDERRRAMADYSAPDSVPSHARRIRGLIASSVHDYEPEILAEGSYDLYSVTVPVVGPEGAPRLTLRITGLPSGASGTTVRNWIDAAGECARRSGLKLAQRG